MTFTSVVLNSINTEYPFQKSDQQSNVLANLYDHHEYNHYSNLTAWNANFKNAGLETSLFFDENAVYYENDGCLYGINATSQITSPSGESIIIQHGMEASRVFMVNHIGENVNDMLLNNDHYYCYEWCGNASNAQALSDMFRNSIGFS